MVDGLGIYYFLKSLNPVLDAVDQRRLIPTMAGTDLVSCIKCKGPV